MTVHLLCWEEKLILQVVFRNFPKIIAWQCSILRLELAGRSIVETIHGMNYSVITSVPRINENLVNLLSL